MNKKFEQMKAKEALLTAEELRKLLDYNPETGEFYWKVDRVCIHAGTKAGIVHHRGYVTITIKGKSYLAHRLAWLHYYGEWPANDMYQIDHINGNRADNRIINLRLATKSNNASNRKVPICNTSGVIGVAFSAKAKRWIAYINAGEYDSTFRGRKRIHLGSFIDFESAVKARKEAEKKYGFLSRKE